MKNNGKDTNQFELIEGNLPKQKKITYDWETKKTYGFEPWWLSTLVLLLDVFILYMYFFINVLVEAQLFIGYTLLILNSILIFMSFWLCHKKSWSQSAFKFSKLIQNVALCITVVVFIITFLLSPIK